MSCSSISQNFVEKSFSFLELFQKNMRGVILTPLRFLRINSIFMLPYIMMDLPILVIAEWATLLVDIRCPRGGS